LRFALSSPRNWSALINAVIESLASDN
jgi:hypothetical protein